MNRFLCRNLKKETCEILDKKEIHHLKDVLRLKKGKNISIFDGYNTTAVGKIIEISNKSIKVKILEKTTKQRNKTLIILACAIPKKSKFEFIIEKCTELGIDEIIPLKTKRTEVKLSEDKLKKKAIRFENVSINASKQSKRTTLPKIHPISTLNNSLKHLTENSIGLIGSLEGMRKNLRDVVTKDLKSKDKIIFFIGPEGDFTTDEVSSAIKSGCIPVSLGKTTLKVDTAAISVVSFSNFIINT
ncbi:MAG: RsmE family RNA methyltransferase [Candidatus Aceula lacicola]|nr:RsmE family RNA methyltransferase [Candidatus Aceula lacicola]